MNGSLELNPRDPSELGSGPYVAPPGTDLEVSFNKFRAKWLVERYNDMFRLCISRIIPIVEFRVYTENVFASWDYWKDHFKQFPTAEHGPAYAQCGEMYQELYATEHVHVIEQTFPVKDPDITALFGLIVNRTMKPKQTEEETIKTKIDSLEKINAKVDNLLMMVKVLITGSYSPEGYQKLYDVLKE